MEKVFDRKKIESKWYRLWEEGKVFKAQESSDKTPYVIMMPPPNVTGVLHNGHALFVTLQDTLARFWRMKGKDVLWLPGTDHAGISTQTVVERELKKKHNKTKYDLGRENFLRLVFEWKDKHGERIIEQLKLLGASADWSRLRFTMDDQCSLAVRTAFYELWQQGLIYRKERLVSLDPVTKTALSNEEVEHVERDGELFYFAYKVADQDKEIVVATTRPETMLGDTAVAVHPQDHRYKNLIGCKLIHPFNEKQKVVVIADDYVDKDFGSGAVKITPAHDPNDFLMGQRHNLPMINIFNLDGTINQNGGKFFSMDRFLARKEVKKELELLGLKRKVEQIKHSVTVSQRSGADIEPMLSRQYFVDAKPLAKKAYDAVESGEVNIIPKAFKKTWDHFLLNIEDWCISRQLWWGHRIPVYYHIETMKEAINKFKPHYSYQALSEGQEIEKVLRIALDELDDQVIKSFSHVFIDPPEDHEQYLQEEDVLDTWFSSGLWPFSTLGWPNKTFDLDRYYPTDVLETGFDILFFWVARMMMMGLHFMGRPPFKDIYLHSMVRDSHGRKMSKSLGNAIDPIDVIEGIKLEDLINKTKTYPVPEALLPKVIDGIKKDFPDGIPSAGADGLRLSLAVFSGQGQDVKFSVPRVVGYRSFLNKVWNATRFAMMNIEELSIIPIAELNNFSVADRYILSRLNRAIALVDDYISHYKFSEAAEVLYHFFWHEYCDTYIECAKVAFKNDSKEQKNITASVLIHLLDTSMRMLHPFCPFISEEIWQSLPTADSYKDKGINFCATAPFPQVDDLVDIEAENAIELIMSVSTMIKNARQTSDISSKQEVEVKLFAQDDQVNKVLLDNQQLIGHIAKTSSIHVFLKSAERPDALCVINASAKVDVYVMLEGLIDPDKELKRLDNNILKLDKQKSGLMARLNNKNFTNNAPKEIVDEQKRQLDEIEQKILKLEESKAVFSRKNKN